MQQEGCCCQRKELPWSGRGTSLDISGCRFSLYPMDSGFVSIILGALEKTDTSAVWKQSDALSTVYRGRLPYVADAVRGLFVNAWRQMCIRDRVRDKWILLLSPVSRLLWRRDF